MGTESSNFGSQDIPLWGPKTILWYCATAIKIRTPWLSWLRVTVTAQDCKMNALSVTVTLLANWKSVPVSNWHSIRNVTPKGDTLTDRASISECCPHFWPYFWQRAGTKNKNKLSCLLWQMQLQPADIGWPTGNGKKLSKSQACCLAQLCQAAA